MIILQGLTVEELLEKLSVLIDKKIQEREKQHKPAAWTYMSRKEVAAHLKISQPTLHDLTKLGWLTAYKIGTRVLYKSNEVDKTILERKFKKYTPPF
ncbi:MAG TPA: helix-turn-helix domain-containing protein [Chitinophagaceae bacterium]|jgi:excisionase family DNA binding protein|nr:helix-turn-helix domain-containing protein [Chitinophagaceae bacterium]